MPEAAPRPGASAVAAVDDDPLDMEPCLSIGQVAELTECLDLITFKIRLYEACRAQGSGDPLLLPEPPSEA